MASLVLLFHLSGKTDDDMSRSRRRRRKQSKKNNVVRTETIGSLMGLNTEEEIQVFRASIESALKIKDPSKLSAEEARKIVPTKAYHCALVLANFIVRSAVEGFDGSYSKDDESIRSRANRIMRAISSEISKVSTRT